MCLKDPRTNYTRMTSFANIFSAVIKLFMHLKVQDRDETSQVFIMYNVHPRSSIKYVDSWGGVSQMTISLHKGRAQTT